MPWVRLSEKLVAKPDLEVEISFAKDEWLFFRGHPERAKNGSIEDVLAGLWVLGGLQPEATRALQNAVGFLEQALSEAQTRT